MDQQFLSTPAISTGFVSKEGKEKNNTTRRKNSMQTLIKQQKMELH